MRILLFISILFSSLAFSSNPDILVYSKVNTEWNVFLLNKFQVFMKNLELNVDPYYYYHNDIINYDESSINDFVSDDVSLFIEDIEKASGLTILELHPELNLSGFGYSIDKILPTIKPIEINGDLELASRIKLEGLKAFGEELKLSFLISTLDKTERISALDVKILNPKITIKNDEKLCFDLTLLLEEGNDETRLNFTKANFDMITKALSENENLVEITYDSVEIPNVELNLMGRSITVNSNKVKEIIDNNKSKIKKLFVGQIKTLFERNGALEVLKHFDKTTFKNSQWIKPTTDTAFPMFIGLKDYAVPFKDIVRVELEGDFCTTSNFLDNNENCIHNKITSSAKSMVTTADISYSLKHIENIFEESEDVSLLASISEDYINKAISTTVDFGLWDEMLQDVGLELGDQNVQVRFNKESQTATLFLDVIYKVDGVKGFITKEKNIRFPLVLDVKIRIEKEEKIRFDSISQSLKMTEVPFVVFNIFDVDLDDNYFNYGISEYDLPSTIGNVRKIVRKKVIKTVKDELLDFDAPQDKMTLLKWKGTDVPPIELPEINGMSLDKVETYSDGHGRLNLVMKSSKVISN